MHRAYIGCYSSTKLSANNMKKSTVRNVLIVFGCYWLAMWGVVPIAIIYGKITSGIIYSGEIGILLMYIVTAIPVAIVASGAGILCVYSLEVVSHRNWLFFLTLLFAVFNFISFHWAKEPGIIDLISQSVHSIIPAISCYLSGIIISNRIQRI